MRRRTGVNVVALCGALLVGGAVRAQDVDPAALYDLSTDGSSQKLKLGEKGSFVLSIKPKAGAHVSTEAPLKLELKGTALKPEKEKLTLSDSVGKKQPGSDYAEPRFEVPFAATAAGKTSLEAKLVFFICTDKLCARQQKAVSVPVDVL